MSQENVEQLRAAVEAARAGTSDSDRQAWLHLAAGDEGWDPQIEWDCSAHPVPDLRGVYTGQ